jgi:hypothetical protein
LSAILRLSHILSYAALASLVLAATGVDRSLSAPSPDALTDTKYSVPGSSARVIKSGSVEPPTGIESHRGPSALKNQSLHRIPNNRLPAPSELE